MPEEMNNRKVFSLHEVTRSIQKTISERYKSSYWIKAELNKLNYYQHSEHCYPELVEKQNGKVIAQIRATLWKDDFTRINTSFQRILNESLKDGIKILFSATINYHPEYGLTLRIIDIDPNFTLGDLEREKQDTIKRLKTEGLFNKNKALKLPLLPQRIAIISVETSKGYMDFLNILESAHQKWDYRFFHFLFPSLLQGDNAPLSIIRQLRKIQKVHSHFDTVAIIRGGGGDLGLTCYNNYDLAREIALFPIPVITGIGHATNQTVVEMIAFENAITPSKLSEFLIQKFHDFSVPIQKAQEKITEKSLKQIADEKQKIHAGIKLFHSLSHNIFLKKQNIIKEKALSIRFQSLLILGKQNDILKNHKDKLSKESNTFLNLLKQSISLYEQQIQKNSLITLKNQNTELTIIEKNIDNMKPENVLKRGYSITLVNGKSILSDSDLKYGDVLNTILYQGNIISTVTEPPKTSENE